MTIKPSTTKNLLQRQQSYHKSVLEEDQDIYKFMRRKTVAADMKNQIKSSSWQQTLMDANNPKLSKFTGVQKIAMLKKNTVESTDQVMINLMTKDQELKQKKEEEA